MVAPGLITFAKIAQQFRKEQLMPETKPSMPGVTPGDGVGAATVALFIGVATSAPSKTVEMTALICAAVVASVSVIFHQRLRAERNETERVRVQAAAEPAVILESEYDEQD